MHGILAKRLTARTADPTGTVSVFGLARDLPRGIYLTYNADSSGVGRAARANPVHLLAGGSIHVHFRVRESTGAGVQGLALVWDATQPSQSGAWNPGGGLVVQLDWRDNGAGDPGSPYAHVYTGERGNGGSVLASSSTANVADGNWHQLEVTLAPETFLLRVLLDHVLVTTTAVPTSSMATATDIDGLAYPSLVSAQTNSDKGTLQVRAWDVRMNDPQGVSMFVRSGAGGEPSRL